MILLHFNSRIAEVPISSAGEILARSGTLVRMHLLAAAIALTPFPVLAQSIGSPEEISASSAASTKTENQESAPILPNRDAQSRQQMVDDAQLPAYLQGDPQADSRSAAFDPWERYNRRMYRFNKRLDHAILKPAALEYVRMVPQPVRTGVSHFFQNLGQPVTCVNLLLEGHPASAGKSLGRFAINTTIGIGGVFDPATKMHIPLYNKDFGQTLGHWGWRRSRYFLLPFAGPGTIRDRVGSLADAQIGPYRFVQPLQLRVGLFAVSAVDMRARALPLDDLTAGIEDDYLLVREAWSQRRMHQIDDQSSGKTDVPMGDSLNQLDLPVEDASRPATPAAAAQGSSQPITH